jgi:hypothetical protein
MAGIKTNTHLVLKNSDIEKYLDADNLKNFNYCLKLIQDGRFTCESHDNSYMVCNWDEPYASKVFLAILQGEDEKTSKKVINEIYQACKNLGANSDLLSILGSYGDTMSGDEVLEVLTDYNSASDKVEQAEQS